MIILNLTFLEKDNNIGIVVLINASVCLNLVREPKI